MNSWKLAPFEELYAEPSRNGLTRPKRVRGSGYKMINMGEIFAYNRICNPPMELVPLNDKEKKKYCVKAGDLLFARQSLVASGAGKCSIVLETPEITTFESHLIRVRLDSQKTVPLFYFYYFNSPQGKGNIQSLIMQVAAAGIRGSELAKLLVPYPPFPTQQKIATILSAYDELIENNARRIQILDEMAQTIYREWFVNFRFPGHEKVKMIDSPLGKIPETWKVTMLNDVLTILESGSRPKGGIDPYVHDVPSIGAENILGLGKYIYSKEKYVSLDFFKKMKKGHIKNGDVLLYKDGAKIGRKSMFRDGFPHSKACINEHVFILRTNDKCNQKYLYFWLDLPEMTARIKSINSNAAQPGINQKGVRGLPILLPNQQSLNLFDNFVEPMLAELFNLANKNRLLAHIRDLLLPKLIYGDIDVSNLDIDIGGEST